MGEMMGSDMSSTTPRQIQAMRRMLKKHQSRGINVGYLKTVLFPEQFSYEIPIPMSSISYCKFTDKQEITINTGPTGQGVIIWFPRTNGGPSVFYFTAGITGSAQTKDSHNKGMPQSASGAIPLDAMYTYTVAGANTSDRGYWQPGFGQYSAVNFTQTAIIGATISMQYVGKVESEAGLWTGGHIYGVGVEKLTIDDIENSQWVTRGRPGEGLRFVFLPKDQTDYEFYPCNQGYAMVQGGAPTSEGNSQVVKMKSLNRLPLNDAELAGKKWYKMMDGQPWAEASDPGSFFASAAAQQLDLEMIPEKYRALIKEIEQREKKSLQEEEEKKAGQMKQPLKAGEPPLVEGSGISYVRNTNYIAMYWTGMEPNKDWIRIDTIRKFAGIPTQATRDIVDLTRPSKSYDANKTFGVLNMLCNNAPIGGHTLKEVDRVIDALMDVLPNAGYYLDQGGIPKVKSLDDLVLALADPTGTDSKQLDGSLTGQTKQLYNYY